MTMDNDPPQEASISKKPTPSLPSYVGVRPPETSEELAREIVIQAKAFLAIYEEFMSEFAELEHEHFLNCDAEVRLGLDQFEIMVAFKKFEALILRYECRQAMEETV